MTVRFLRVGGIVRDRLRGVPSKDTDLIALGCTSSDPFREMCDAFLARGGRIYENTERPEFGSARGHLPGVGAVDFNLPRDDGFSSDSRRPDSVVLHDSLERDLLRRDFTVNAMAENEDGTIVDIVGGQDDLALNALRFVGDPVERLAEDALRAFRGIRFEIVKGLTMTCETLEAIQAMTVDQFDAVHVDRIRDELVPCFGTDTRHALALLNRCPVLFELALERGLWLKPTLEKP